MLRKLRNFFRRLFRRKGGVWVRTDEDSPWVRLSDGASVKFEPREPEITFRFEHAETVHKRFWNREEEEEVTNE